MIIHSLCRNLPHPTPPHASFYPVPTHPITLLTPSLSALLTLLYCAVFSADYNRGFGSLPASAYAQRRVDREEIKRITDVRYDKIRSDAI